MKTEFIILILVFEIMIAYSLNKYISTRKGMIILLVISFILFVIGLWTRQMNIIIDYKLLLVPFAVIALLSISHILFRLLFNIPFNLNMRRFEYPDELKSNSSGFIEFLSLGISICIPILILILFFIIK